MGGQSAVGYGQLRNKYNYFYLSTDDEHRIWEGDEPLDMDNPEANVIIFYLSTDHVYRVWEGDQPLVMDNSETNVIISIYPRMISIRYGRANNRWLWTTLKQM